MLLLASIKIETEARVSMMMTTREACPQCGSIWYKKNGRIHTGKQNHRCKVCGRAFVRLPENHRITEEQRTLIARLLLERISLTQPTSLQRGSTNVPLTFTGSGLATFRPQFLQVRRASSPQKSSIAWLKC